MERVSGPQSCPSQNREAGAWLGESGKVHVMPCGIESGSLASLESVPGDCGSSKEQGLYLGREQGCQGGLPAKLYLERPAVFWLPTSLHLGIDKQDACHEKPSSRNRLGEAGAELGKQGRQAKDRRPAVGEGTNPKAVWASP